MWPTLHASAGEKLLACGATEHHVSRMLGTYPAPHKADATVGLVVRTLLQTRLPHGHYRGMPALIVKLLLFPATVRPPSMCFPFASNRRW